MLLLPHNTSSLSLGGILLQVYKCFLLLILFCYIILSTLQILLFFCLQIEGTDKRVVQDMEGACQANQRRMNADPLEVMLLNMGYRITGLSGGGPASGDGGSDDEDSAEGQVQCRPS